MKTLKDLFREFPENLKNYIDVILKLNFGELFVYVLELVLLMVLAVLMYVPVGLIKDLIITILNSFVPNVKILYSLVEILFSLLSVFVFAITFIYGFNGRYNDLNKDMKEKAEKKAKEEENIDLPKSKK